MERSPENLCLRNREASLLSLASSESQKRNVINDPVKVTT